VQVEIWSDVVCPWCYIGKRRFEEALRRFDAADAVEVVWRSFELDPSAPPVREGDYVTRIPTKYGMSREQAEAAIDRMVGAGDGDGLDLRFDLARPGNTFGAHRILHLAAQHGCQDALKERLLRATFSEGEPIGDRDTLERLAVDAGLDADEVREVLDGDAFAAEVRSEERRAGELGISAVPFFVIDGRYGVAGAQHPDVLLAALEQAWSERGPLSVVTAGDACEGDDCAI
jgi:predicted DsbA family dithiol-disulfide isomerase